MKKKEILDNRSAIEFLEQQGDLLRVKKGGGSHL